MTRILITKPILPEAVELFRAEPGWEVIVRNGLDPAALRAEISIAEGVLAMLSDKFDSDAFADAKDGPLAIVANYAVGFDNIDLEAANEAGVWATNTPGALTEATAESAWALLFAAARRIGEGERLVRAGAWRGWEPTQLVGAGVSGKTLGIVGCGRIGMAFGRMAKGFNMRILYFSTSPKREFEVETGAKKATLDELLTESDFVSIHLPAHTSTRHIISAEKLRLMKRSAVLVNTGRGNVVDENALVEALRAKRIAAAGLDVYEHEPRLAPGLAELENVVLAPHIGSATFESRMGMARIAIENIRAALEGRRPPQALNDPVV